MKRHVLIITFLFLSVTLFSQTGTFAGADYSQGIAFVMENGRIVWKHQAPECNDLWVLPNGNLLFTIGRGVLEMTRQNDTVFHYASESPVFACQRLSNGNTFVGECNTGRLLEVSPAGKVVEEVRILPEGTDGGFAFMRNARKLDNGHYLVAHYGNENVKEYDTTGQVVWKIDVPGGPISAVRLPNGHTLIAVADKNQNPRIIEVTRKGNIVWEISNTDIPGQPLKFLSGFQYFSDGRLLFTNWTGHVQMDPANKIHLFMVDKKKNILYSMKNTKDLQTMSSVFSVDYPAKVISYH